MISHNACFLGGIGFSFQVCGEMTGFYTFPMRDARLISLGALSGFKKSSESKKNSQA
jgi:hypothetical protein